MNIKLTKAQKIEHIMTEVVVDKYQPKHQQISFGVCTGVRLTHPDFGIIIQIDIYKSQLKNNEIAKKLFEFALAEHIKD